MQPAGFYEGSGMDISFQGQLNKRFTGFGRYTWSHYESNTNGIGWFPQDQRDPESEWSDSSWDRRHRLGMYSIFNRESLLNIAVGIFANTGTPWTEVTGTDDYGTDLFNTRPAGVGRNTRRYPSYVDTDLRWGHDFALTSNKADEAPHLGFSAGAFNVMNHVNPSAVDTVVTSSTYGDVIAVNSPRRVQLSMRFQF
jgi:hypothetical protein